MDSKITKAIVSFDGAELTRQKTVCVEPGKNRIVFGGLTMELLPKSIEAAVAENVQLITVFGHVVYQKPPSVDEKIQNLQKELEACEQELKENQMKQGLLEEEEVFLRGNRRVGGTQGATLNDIKTIEEYYKNRFLEIAEKRLQLQLDYKTLEKKKEKYLEQLGGYQTEYEASYEIIVELAAEKKEEIQVQVSYFIKNAGWKPIYEIRVADLKQPVQLVCKGEVYQKTGEDWKDILLILSSKTPETGGKLPKLFPYYLDVSELAVEELKPMKSWKKNNILEEEIDLCSLNLPIEAEVKQTQISIEYILPGLVTVTALQEEEKRFVLAEHELSAVFRHFCIPKLDSNVYLIANIEHWQTLNLLDGEASIFLNNTYVGSTMLEFSKAEECMELYLGKDSNVFVSRVKGKDFSGRTLMGLNNKVSREWKITARNTRRDKITLQIYDQIPVSIAKGITVETVELSGAVCEKDTGKICWERELKEGASIEFRLKYTVTYPKNESLVIE